MRGERYENLTGLEGRNEATAGVAGATLYVTNDCTYGQLDTESSGEMEPASSQAPPPPFVRKRIGNAIAVDNVGSPVRV